MKRILRRAICLALTFAMVVTVLSACSLGFGKASLPGDIDEEGRFVFTIVRGASSSTKIEAAAKTIRSAIKENFDCKVTVTKDSAVEDIDGSYEILVGDTDRPASDEALQVLKDNRAANAYDFIVKVIGTKICLQATNDAMVAVAADWFAETFCDDADSWALLKQDYEFLYAPKSQATLGNKVGGVELGLFTLVKPVRYSYVIGQVAEEMRDFYSDYGFTMAYNEDMDPVTDYEILIGDTERPESRAVVVEDDNYVIKVVGTKLVVKGGSDLATYRAMKYVMDECKASTGGTVFEWSDGYVVNGKYDPEEENVYTLNLNDEFDQATPNFNLWGDNCAAAYRSSSSCLGGTTYDCAGNYSWKYQSDYGHDKSYMFPCKYNPSGRLMYNADGYVHMGTQLIEEDKPNTTTPGEYNDFVGCYMSTYSAMLYKYGIWEVNGKVGEAPACVSLWLNGTGEQNLQTRYGNLMRACMTEVDLIEDYGSVTSFGSNVHRWWQDYTSDMQSSFQGHNSMGGNGLYNTEDNNMNYKYDKARYGGDLATTDHTYSYYWDDRCMKFAFDGKVYCTYNYTDENSTAVHCLMNYLIISCSMGSASYGATWKRDSSPKYCEAEWDSVRIYQTAAINSQMIYAWGEFEPADPSKVRYIYPEHEWLRTY